MKRIAQLLLAISCVLALAPVVFGASKPVTKVTEFALPSLSGQPYRPRISGDWVVYVRNYEKRAENVWLVNVPSKKVYSVFDIADGTSIGPVIDGNFVVWPGKADQVAGLRGTLGKRGQLSRSMIIYDLSTGEYFAPELNTTSAFSVSVCGRRVAYELGSRIYLYDMTNGAQMRISDNNPCHLSPEISGDIVVWTAKPNGSDRRQIFSYQISTGQQTQLTEDDVDHRSSRTDGRYIVWWTDAGVDVHDTKNGSTFTIPKAYFPAVDDGILVYQRSVARGMNPVFGMDIATRQEFRVSSGSANIGPDIDAGRVIWGADGGVHCAELSTRTTK